MHWCLRNDERWMIVAFDMLPGIALLAQDSVSIIVDEAAYALDSIWLFFAVDDDVLIEVIYELW